MSDHNIFDQPIDRLGTYCTQWDYIEDRFGVKELLPFSISDTDFAVPDAIMSEIYKRLEHHVFGYTRWNHNDFKGAIRDWYKTRLNTSLELDWILYSPSVIYSIAKLIELKSEPGDQVIVQTPAYDAFFKCINDNHRILVQNELIYDINAGYQINFKELEQQLSDPKAKVLLLCSPHNPTGRVWTPEELTHIFALCDQYDVFVISDEIHMDIRREGVLLPSPINYINDISKIAICNSASKTFNIPGLICSYLAIPDEALRADFLTTLKNRDGLSSTSILGMLSTIAAYRDCSSWVDDLNRYLDENFSILSEFIKKELPELSFETPESTYLAWINTSKLPFSSDALQQALIHQGKVAIMPGNTYGSEPFLRMNIGCSQAKLKEGLIRLKVAVDYLKRS